MSTRPISTEVPDRTSAAILPPLAAQPIGDLVGDVDESKCMECGDELDRDGRLCCGCNDEMLRDAAADAAYDMEREEC